MESSNGINKQLIERLTGKAFLYMSRDINGWFHWRAICPHCKMEIFVAYSQEGMKVFGTRVCGMCGEPFDYIRPQLKEDWDNDK